MRTLIDNNNNYICYRQESIECNIQGCGNKIIVDNVDIQGRLNISVAGNDNEVIIDEGLFSGDSRIMILQNNNATHIKQGFKFRNSQIRQLGGTSLVINEQFTISGEDIIDLEPNSEMSIGYDCLLSSNVLLQSGDGHCIYDIKTSNKLNVSENKKTGYVIIGEHVWIGRNAAVIGGIKGTSIGNGSLVGSGAVVKGKYSNNVSIVGNPSVLLRENVAWSRSFILSRGLEDCNGYTELSK